LTLLCHTVRYIRTMHYKVDEVLPVPGGVELPHLFCDTQTILERYGERLWMPELSAGDVLIFNHFVVHRTYVTDCMTKERQSVDFRVFPQSRVPDYVLTNAGWFFELTTSKVADFQPKLSRFNQGLRKAK